MRRFALISTLVLVLGLSVPVRAQLRSQVTATSHAPVRVFEQGSRFLLNKLFNPAYFKMGHSYELSYGSYGGRGLMTGVYTNSLMWQFSDKLAARVDIGFMHTPLGTGAFKQQFGGRDFAGKIFLRNAEIAYRPKENVFLHFSFRQSPYGRYASPYGYDDRYASWGFSDAFDSHR